MLEKKEYLPHVQEALLDAISTLETLEKFYDVLKPNENTVSTLKSMLGIRETISDVMNAAIADQVEKYNTNSKE